MQLDTVRDRPFSVHWIYERDKVLRRDSYVCRLCGAEEDLVVHHLNYRHQPLYELITLCARCHVRAHKMKRDERRAFTFDWINQLKDEMRYKQGRRRK